MGVYKIAIVDDETDVLDQIESYVKKYQSEKNDEFFSDRFTDAIDFKAAKFLQYDLVFLDIEMPLSNGFEVAKYLRKNDYKGCIVFITNLTTYAVAGYSVDIFDYIVKPLSYKKFENMLSRALKSVEKERLLKTLNISNNGDLFRIPLNTIIFIEIMGHQITIHTVNGDYSTWGSLGKIEEELPDDTFLRTANCYIINLSFVDAVKGDEIILRGTQQTIRIRRGKKKDFLARLTKFISN